MKVWALVVDTWREALARYTLLGFVIVSSLFMLMLTFALNLDIVDGTLAAGSLFGRAFDLPGGTPIETVVTTGESAFAAMLYGLGIFLAVFATGSQVPNLVHRGTVDLYLSRPVSRPALLLGRFVGAVTLVLANLAFLRGGVFLIISLKTGWNLRLQPRRMIALVFCSCLVHVPDRCWARRRCRSCRHAIYVLAARGPLAADSRLAAWTVHGLYWLLPKSVELGRDVVQLVMGKGELSVTALATTLVFGLGCLAAAVAVFQRRSY